MAVRVAINGFGRIGRLAFRQMTNTAKSINCYSYCHFKFSKSSN